MWVVGGMRGARRLAKAAVKEAGKDLVNRIRATKLAYKAVKSFLVQILTDVPPSSQAVISLAHLPHNLLRHFTDEAT